MDKVRPDNIQFLAVRDLPFAPEFLWALLLDRTAHPEQNISHQKMPSMKEHLEFVVAHPYRVWNIITYAGQWVGVVSLTYRNEIGIQIHKDYRRQGLARAALHRLMQQHTPATPEPSLLPGHFVANIAPKNAASIALFTGLGAELIQVTYRLPGEGGVTSG